MERVNIPEEMMDQPCCVEAPDLWRFYCNLVGRYPDMTATHWTIRDVLDRIQAKGFECQSCGDK